MTRLFTYKSVGIFLLVAVTLMAAGWVSPEPKLGAALWWMGVLALVIFVTGCMSIRHDNRKADVEAWFGTRVATDGHVRVLPDERPVGPGIEWLPPYDWEAEGVA